MPAVYRSGCSPPPPWSISSSPSPAGHWISKRPTGQAVFWSSVLFRIGYFFWIPLPWFFNEQGQIWALIVLAFLMAIPLTPLGVGFNALFAEAVPDRYRARVAGTRNVTFAIAYMLTSLIAGYILKNTEFPGGYQVIFIIGAFGAAMSSYHIYHVKPLQDENPPPAPIPVAASQSVSPRSLTAALRLDVWNSKFKHVLLAMFIFHFSHYLSSPLYPIFNVRVLNLNDSHLGNGITGWGVAGMASYPLMLAFAQNVWQFYALSFLGGFLFAMVNGAYANYMLENIPPDDRPSHLAWYTIMFNFAILASSLIGPVTADAIGLINALIVFGIARMLDGLFLLKWG
ncbi:MAG: MFS transporter [Anaerolineales bacterium]|nr:MFS transporter [Anaerolineales bacterium]